MLTPAMLGAPMWTLGLKIDGSPLEPIIRAFTDETATLGLAKPHYYLSTSWRAWSGGISVPFHLADPDLADIHAQHVGPMDGLCTDGVLRRLRHELGCFVYCAYRLHEHAAFRKLFGDCAAPCPDEPAYPFDPFSRDFVRYLPGFCAQRHAREDWAETFATWIHPGHGSLLRYAGWDRAITKLLYCGSVLRGLRWVEPVCAADAPADDVAALEISVNDFYLHRDRDEG